ncbi:SDR family oxidoreductase [Alkalihalobacterium alkalinitrilicum]|uniref:SDR family oxidoreductase n=1 Tax=Alkalihalobacterium alkalinitrilicum TaxID=427920 RepID=UPI0009959688|nr:SDR family oxidoreductase [Alkalihalobacterium alkalinitrilicum]
MNVLVIGGSKGIGKATALRFSEKDNNIFINYASDDHAAKETFEEVKQKGANVHLLKADVGDSVAIKTMMDKIKNEVDQLDLIVHCAVAVIPGNALDLSKEEWDRAVAVSNFSIIEIIKEAMPLLRYGSTFLALSSRGATHAIGNYAALGTTKAFTEALVRYLMLELAPKGIRINVVSPGTLYTDALEKVFPGRAEELVKMVNEKNPSNRGISFEDVTDTIAFLASPQAQMIQGRVIHIDGGIGLI